MIEKRVSLAFGVLILLGAFLLFFAGGTLLLVNGVLTASDRFPTGDLYTSSYAIVVKNINVNLGETGLWRPNPTDVVTIRLSGSNNNPTKSVFIGIAEMSDVNTYLQDVEYNEVTNLIVEGNPLQGFKLNVGYTIHSGLASPQDPTSVHFWEVSTQGANTQTMSWMPRTGAYWVIFMNADGSAGVDVRVGVGAEIPILSTIVVVFLLGGVPLLIIGIAFLYLRIKHPS
jgi:hypothetical protein